MTLSAVTFDCGDARLCGILHLPAEQVSATGVLVITGGPQYRIGSHRQFVQLGATLAQRGFACMRFDHRGSGDSDGEVQPFDQLDDDIRAAVDCFKREVPAVTRVVLWGLCDAASAALIYAHTDPRIAGLVLLNPWVRQQQTQAQTHLRNWYRDRLTNRDFWKRLATGQVYVLRSLRGLLGNLLAARRPGRSEPTDFVGRMLEGARNFNGAALLILSGDDLTAREFELVAASDAWKPWFDSEAVTRVAVPKANHTFSRRDWKKTVAESTVDWLRDAPGA